MRALALLTLWQVRNWIRTTLTNPRKLIPAILIIGWMSMNLFFMGIRGRMGGRTPELPGATEFLLNNAGLVDSGIFLLLILASLAILNSGFSQGFLTFSLADIDYLFTSPVSRRAVLSYRLAAKTVQGFFQSAFMVLFIVFFVLRGLLPYARTPVAFLTVVAALFFCLSGYTNIAFILKLVFGFGRSATLKRWVSGITVAAVGLVGLVVWRQGLPQLETLAQSWLVTVPFYPCRMAATLLMAPLTQNSSAMALPLLLVFYFGTLGLLMSRRENYYEASIAGSERVAAIREAARSQKFGALFALQQGGKARRAYTIRPWGTGAAALLWAHLAAAAKRPWINCYLPLALGLAVSILACIFMPENTPPFIPVAFVTGYIMLGLTSSGSSVYRQTLARQPIIRPLPLKPWQVVGAAVATRVITATLYMWSAGIVLMVAGRASGVPVGLGLILGGPPTVLMLDLLGYSMALWYPNAQDKLQQLIANLIGFALVGAVALAVAAVMAPLTIAILAFGLPLWLIPVAYAIPVSLTIPALFLLASRTYSRFQPTD